MLFCDINCLAHILLTHKKLIKMNKKLFITIEIFALVVFVVYLPLVVNPALILKAPEWVMNVIMIVGIMVAIATLGVVIVAASRAFRWIKVWLARRR